MTEQTNPYTAPAADVAVRPPGDSRELVYGGFWRRFGAYWLDVAVLLPLLGLNYWLGSHFRLFQLYYLVPGALFGWWFHVHLVRRYGGTPGKLMLGLRICRVDGSPAQLREASLRYAVLFVISLCSATALALATLRMGDQEYLSLGLRERSLRLTSLAPAWYGPVTIAAQLWIWSEFLVMLLNRRRRGLHDFMAGTVVVRGA